MTCSRCGRAESHGAVFVEIGEPVKGQPRVYVCGQCFVARDQATDPIVVAVTSYETKSRQSLRERAKAQGRDLP